MRRGKRHCSGPATSVKRRLLDSTNSESYDAGVAATHVAGRLLVPVRTPRFVIPSGAKDLFVRSSWEILRSAQNDGQVRNRRNRSSDLFSGSGDDTTGLKACLYVDLSHIHEMGQ